MTRPRLLDLYCGAGGAAAGYIRAGFEVVGVDLHPQPQYPYEFHQGKALEYLWDHGQEFDAIHASPPCQGNSVLRHSNGITYQDWIPDTRYGLVALGRPYVIENVVGAELVDPLLLCGSMFGLSADGYRLVRHRQFECSVPMSQPVDRCAGNLAPVVGVYGGKVRNRRSTDRDVKSRSGTTLPLHVGQQAMGIDWMDRRALSQAIPPAYTHYIGNALMSVLHG